MNGAELRMGRLFNRESGRAFVTAFDHGLNLRVPPDAVALGAEALVMYLIQGPEEGAMFADNAQAIAQTAREAHQVGLPLIVEATLWGSRIADKRDPDLLAYGCRMAAELG